MGLKVGQRAQLGATAAAKPPRTARGERTMRKILDAAREEFGARGFSETSIVGITQRAGVALGTFYTYFESKEGLFQALVRDMSAQVRDTVGPALAEGSDRLDSERRALAAFLRFALDHRDIYRIIDESEFVDPAAYREHYESTASRIAGRLQRARAEKEIDASFTDDDLEVVAWGMMGANVFLGLRFAVWDEKDADEVAGIMTKVWRKGFSQ
ncbi:MAG TPA: TetR/AcrR family transcriptional regulator [Sphingomicrobium sp.]|nr:TetR/AcrR family transcriptional regulator [Sphingomicrobium sp.]